MKDVFFVRHAQSESNVDSIARGHSAKLTGKGMEQAEMVAERVARLKVEALISSPFIRTQHTAEEIRKRVGLPIETNELFVERRQPSGRIGKSLVDTGMYDLEQQVFEGYAISGYQHSDEETFEDLKGRSLSALEFLAHHEKDRICVVTHGVFLRVLFCAAVHGKNFTGRNMQDCIHFLETDNTGVFYFQYGENRWKTESADSMEWRVKSWNDLSHFG